MTRMEVRGQHIRDGIELVGCIEEADGIRVARMFRAVDITVDDAAALLAELQQLGHPEDPPPAQERAT